MKPAKNKKYTLALGNLMIHIKSVYEGLKKHKCGICDKAFSKLERFNLYTLAVFLKNKNKIANVTLSYKK